MEKETLGLFLSSHPVKSVRAALAARVDCPISALSDKKDGEWATVGGMITEAKKIRTRKGDPMMFATLDDLEGQVEILVFNSAYADNADTLDGDRVVVVRGRVDHKEQGETKLVVHEAEVFEPSDEEVATAAEQASRVAAAPPDRLRLTLDPGVPASFLDELREVVRHFPGSQELLLLVGERRLVLGPEFRVADSSALRADLAARCAGAVVA
jgi:DNA polymerase-3 subunit alpha